MDRFRADEESGQERRELDFPPLDGAEHMADYLFAVGPTSGGEALTFQEIQAWCSLTGRVLNAWEAETLRLLSGAYASELFQATDPDRKPPWSAVVFAAVKPSRDDVDARLTAAFDLLERQDAGQG